MVNAFWKIVLICNLFLLILACSHDQKYEQVVEIRDGVKTIINPTELLSREPVEGYELVEELSIGADEGDTNYVFGQPVIGGVDSEGNIYVYDYSMYRISKFDSTGKFILSFGRKGQGPGEFTSAYIEVADNHTIVVSDPNNRRIGAISYYLL